MPAAAQLGGSANAMRITPVLERMTKTGNSHSLLPTPLVLSGGADGAVVFTDIGAAAAAKDGSAERAGFLQASLAFVALQPAFQPSPS